MLGSMQSSTFFRRPLSRIAPSTPLLDDIDVELGSTSESWLLISQSHEDPRVHPSSATVACQTSTLLHSQEVSRSNLKKTLLLQGEDPLQPPTFRPKSKLPRLHYGGLEAPELHCFSSAHCQHDEAEASGPSFVAFKKAALDKTEIPEEHVSKSTQVVGDLNEELSINAITLQHVLEL